MTLLSGPRRPRSRHPGDRGPRHHGEQGATLVELAIVGLLLFTMILGIFEFGLLFRDNMTANDAVSDAVRIGAILGPDVTPDGRNADYEIVSALREGLSALDDSDVAAIVVFRSSGSDDSPEDQVPTPCRSGVSVVGVCNAYDVPSAFAAVEAADTSYFVCGGGNTASCAYDPATRDDGPARADIETIGVYVRVERGGYTGLFADTWTISRAAINRLEPGVVE